MSGTTPETSSTTAITTLQDASTNNNGHGAVVIGTSVAAVLVILCSIFLIFYAIHWRRRQKTRRYSIESDPEMSTGKVSKLDFLPQEPPPPPPPYKHVLVDGEIGSDMVPPLPPPKDLDDAVDSRNLASYTLGEDSNRTEWQTYPSTISYPEKSHQVNPSGIF